MDLPPEDPNEGNDPQEGEEEELGGGAVGRGLTDEEKSIIIQEILQRSTGYGVILTPSLLDTHTHHHHIIVHPAEFILEIGISL